MESTNHIEFALNYRTQKKTIMKIRLNNLKQIQTNFLNKYPSFNSNRS